MSAPSRRRLHMLAATALAWTLFVGGWLVLGAFGRSTSALWFDGLGPVAAWLAVAGATAVAPRAPSRAVVVGAAAVAVAGVSACWQWGGSLAAIVAGCGWGGVSGAASRRAGDAHASACLPARGASRDPAQWPASAARCAMLPMMAAMAVAPDWCAGPGVTAGEGAALQLAAMLVPALLSRRGPRSPTWIAAFMAAGLLALALLPGVRGWLAMSLLHAVAWGLAWSGDGNATCAPENASTARGRASRWTAVAAMMPAAMVLALGSTIAVFGLDGLVGVHAGLGVAAVAGWIVAGTGRHARARRARGARLLRTLNEEMLG